ncbi:MAG: P-loop domain-containing protein [bacterium]
MLPWERLRDKLYTLEGKPYAAYKALEGEYRFDRFVLFLDYMQADPSGPPSPMRVRVDQAEVRLAGDLWATRVKRIALEDYLARRWQEAIRKVSRGGRGGGRSAGFVIDAGNQHVLERTACRIEEDFVEIRAGIVLPSEGRRAVPKDAQVLLLEDLPQIAGLALMADHPGRSLDPLQRHLDVAEDAEALRAQLGARGLLAFIADGAILPREPGSDRPQLSRVVTFQSPPELRVTLEAPHRGSVSGLGIPRGVTLITGPAFSGKSSLLSALSACVYPHLPGDGREYCVTVPDAVYVTREGGRRVEAVSLTPFVTMLPGGEDVRRYRADHAPDLVSQVAAITEALELGSPLLLIDEDSTAPPLLQRDAFRATLMPGASEPVVPMRDLARRLFAEHGISTILVSGTASEFAAVADTIIGMDGFRPLDITQGAKQAAAGTPVSTSVPEGPFGGIGQRVPAPESVSQFRGRRVRSEARGERAIAIGREQVDMHGVAQLVEAGQARAIGDAIVFAAERGYVDGSRSLREIVSLIDAELSERGLEALSPFSGHPGDYARPRRHEIAAAFNRLRTLRIRS